MQPPGHDLSARRLWARLCVDMFVLADGASMGGMRAMAGSSATSRAVFSVGAALIVASFVVTPLRRRRGTCAPVLAALRR